MNTNEQCIDHDTLIIECKKQAKKINKSIKIGFSKSLDMAAKDLGHENWYELRTKIKNKIKLNYKSTILTKFKNYFISGFDVIHIDYEYDNKKLFIRGRKKNSLLNFLSYDLTIKEIEDFIETIGNKNEYIDIERFGFSFYLIPAINGFSLIIKEVKNEANTFIKLSFEELLEKGFNKEQVEIIETVLKNENRYLIVGGATGSGKSTTLNYIHKILIKNKNIITINTDYGIQDLSNQELINPKEKPIHVFLEDIREKKYADSFETIIKNGDSAYSTIHAIGTMGIIYNFNSLNNKFFSEYHPGVLIYQQIHKKICSKCCREANIQDLDNYNGKLLFNYLIKNDKLKDFNKIKVPGKGCNHCNDGYIGKIPVFEVLEINQITFNMIKNKKFEELENFLLDQKTSYIINYYNKILSGEIFLK